jgi:hypothetical protein
MLFFFSAGVAAAQDAGKDPLAILEVGGNPSKSLSGGGWTMSPTVAVEFTPIENWLELEIGTTPIFARHSTEWETDLLFKKPWTLSRKVELMAGVGPTWIHSREAGVSSNAAGAEAALDLMIWPGAKHHFGWYVEPAYGRSFGRGHEQSIGLSVGLLIAIRPDR